MYQISSYDGITTDLLHDRNKGHPKDDRRIVGGELSEADSGERILGRAEHLDFAQPPKLSKIETKLITMTRLLTSQVSRFALPHGHCFDMGRAERLDIRRPSEVGIS